MLTLSTNRRRTLHASHVLGTWLLRQRSTLHEEAFMYHPDTEYLDYHEVTAEMYTSCHAFYEEWGHVGVTELDLFGNPCAAQLEIAQYDDDALRELMQQHGLVVEDWSAWYGDPRSLLTDELERVVSAELLAEQVNARGPLTRSAQEIERAWGERVVFGAQGVLYYGSMLGSWAVEGETVQLNLPDEFERRVYEGRLDGERLFLYRDGFESLDQDIFTRQPDPYAIHHHPDPNEAFGALREALQVEDEEQRHQEAWEDAAEALLGWPADRCTDEVVPYVAGVLARWPDRARTLPDAWHQRLDADRPIDHLFTLVRTLRVTPTRCEDPFALWRMMRHEALRAHVTTLDLTGLEEIGHALYALGMAGSAGRWPVLGAVLLPEWLAHPDRAAEHDAVRKLTRHLKHLKPSLLRQATRRTTHRIPRAKHST